MKGILTIINRILRYLQYTKNMKLEFGINELELINHSNAIFGSDNHDRKSTH